MAGTNGGIAKCGFIFLDTLAIALGKKRAKYLLDLFQVGALKIDVQVTHAQAQGHTRAAAECSCCNRVVVLGVQCRWKCRLILIATQICMMTILWAIMSQGVLYDTRERMLLNIY